jgi:hypothetical protein
LRGSDRRRRVHRDERERSNPSKPKEPASSERASTPMR